MSFKHIDLESAMRRLADHRIEEALREGKFDNLPGAGKPIDLEPMPADENARLAWWALRILRQNNYIPEEVQWRKQIDLLKDELLEAKTEARLRTIVKSVNALVYRINTLGTNALKSPIVEISLEAELTKLRERLASAPAPKPRPALVHPNRLNSVPLCANPLCLTRNPPTAQFCRRCGQPIFGPSR